MEVFSVPILLSLIGGFIIWGVVAAVRRKDDFWEEKREIRRKTPRR